eukprot:scaffold24535_cov186-Cylindrotheca_fusiformis.AAC.2
MNDNVEGANSIVNPAQSNVFTTYFIFEATRVSTFGVNLIPDPALFESLYNWLGQVQAVSEIAGRDSGEIS